jgi:hypothetical protein
MAMFLAGKTRAGVGLANGMAPRVGLRTGHCIDINYAILCWHEERQQCSLSYKAPRDGCWLHAMRAGKSRRKWKEDKASTDTLLDFVQQLGNDRSGEEPGIFKTLKQAWFGPMAEALISK